MRPARRGDAALGRAAGGDLCELPGETGRAGGDDALVRLQRGPSPRVPVPGAGCWRPGRGPADACGGDTPTTPVPGGPLPRDAGADDAARVRTEDRNGDHREIGLKGADRCRSAGIPGIPPSRRRFKALEIPELTLIPGPQFLRTSQAQASERGDFARPSLLGRAIVIPVATGVVAGLVNVDPLRPWHSSPLLLRSIWSYRKG